MKKLQIFSKGVIIGSLEAIEKEPEKIIVTTAAAVLAPAVIGGLTKFKIATNVLNKIPTSIKKKGAKAVQFALGSLYLTSTGLEVAKQPTLEEKGEVIGNILTSEVAPFIVGTKIGVRGLLKNEIQSELQNEVNKLPQSKREAFKDYIKQAEILGKFEPKSKNIKLDNIGSIKDKKAQQEIRKYLKSNKDEIVVGGSVAQTGQVNVKRQLGDMDLYLEGKLNPNQAAKQLANQLRNKGVERVSVIRGQITIRGEKAIEFHDINRLLANIEQVIPTWQNSRKYIIKTPERIRIQRIG